MKFRTIILSLFAVASTSLAILTERADSPGLSMNRCLNNHYEFGFRYGIGNIENFTLVVQAVNGTQQGYRVISAYAVNAHWICTKNPTHGLQERCELVGVLCIEL
ncbi:uncharacterized protein N7482_007031 [Penicillium canariense]|uniref:Uncharacterized protein n=1 Tax=Penicillium canariense TaxID=189055 RepID=A0A9W9HW14_9EURO|nr:uncharacterized protein N7482_007031 [Penicillium canariense]KAJ5160027.1 hypothetical protein N7482_007031 [Penicillium canariense]